MELKCNNKSKVSVCDLVKHSVFKVNKNKNKQKLFRVKNLNNEIILSLTQKLQIVYGTVGRISKITESSPSILGLYNITTINCDSLL